MQIMEAHFVSSLPVVTQQGSSQGLVWQAAAACASSLQKKKKKEHTIQNDFFAKEVAERASGAEAWHALYWVHRLTYHLVKWAVSEGWQCLAG